MQDQEPPMVMVRDHLDPELVQSTADLDQEPRSTRVTVHGPDMEVLGGSVFRAVIASSILTSRSKFPSLPLGGS